MSNTEDLAVSEATRIIGYCPNLGPSFATNDRTILTDGHIDLFRRGEAHSKRSLIGRVDVQIRGSQRSKIGRLPKTRRIEKEELEGYLTLRGVIYFVVHIEAASRLTATQYVVLNPTYIQTLLREFKPGQRSMAVPVRDMPEDAEHVEGLVAFAHSTRSESLTKGLTLNC